MNDLEPRPRAARNVRHRLKLPEEALEQLDSLIAAYERLRRNMDRPLPGADAEITDLKAKIKDDSAILWWTDLVQAEMCVLEATEDAALRPRLLGWRARMHDVIGDARYATYLSNAPNIATELSAPVMRADLAECIRTVYYFYSAYGISARSRTRATVATMRTAVYLIVAEGAIAGILALLTHPGTPWFTIPAENLGALEFALAASVAAILGSVVSVQRRVQGPAVDADPFYRYIQTTADWVGIAVVPPVFGAIFGIVMYALLISQLMLGTLIKFNPQGYPATPESIALLLLLGFIAGFAEQLIPDALNRIAARALSSVSPGATPTNASGAGGVVAASPKKPTITAVSPPSGAAGSVVVLTGTGFSGANLSATFGTTPGTVLKIEDDTKLSVTSPPGTGTVAVTVTTDAGTSDAAEYTYAVSSKPPEP